MSYRPKLRQNTKFPKTHLKRSMRRIQQPGTHSRSAKREIRIVSNEAVPASSPRMCVSYWFWIKWVRTTISKPNWPKSTFRKPEQREQNYFSHLIAKLWGNTEHFRKLLEYQINGSHSNICNKLKQVQNQHRRVHNNNRLHKPWAGLSSRQDKNSYCFACIKVLWMNNTK